jgi:hypothetical protein
VHRSQMEGSTPHPVGKGRAIKIDALPGIDAKSRAILTP